MVISQIGPQAGASSIVGSDTLPSTPTFRQCYITASGMYVCLADGTWSLLDSADAGVVSGSGVTNRLTKWIDGTGSVLGDSGVADDGTNILALRPFAVGFGLSTPAQLLVGPKITAASIISTSPRGIQSNQYSTDTAGAVVGLQKARGTVGTPTVIVTGDVLGQAIFRGFDGTGYLDMGRIACNSTGTIGTNRVPTTLTFATATDAATSVLTVALTLGADQTATFASTVTTTGLSITAGAAAAATLTLAADAGSNSADVVTISQADGGPLTIKTTNGTVTALSITAAGLVALPVITTDAAHTDSTVCQDTTSHALYAGSGAAGICLGTSSARFKERISDIKEGLAEVLKLRPRNFRYKKGIVDSGARMQYGLVAEEVEQVIPSIVAKGAKGEINSVDYGTLFPLLIKAVQELTDRYDAQIELLNTRLNTALAR